MDVIKGVGDGCDSCLYPRDLWTNPDIIEEGFEMNRTRGKVHPLLLLYKFCHLKTFLRKC